MIDDHETTIKEMQFSIEKLKEGFEVEKQSLKDDHASSLAELQKRMDKEMEETAGTHAKEITTLKEEIASVTTSFEEKLEQAANKLKETIIAHEAALETLAKEKDDLIAAGKESKAARETELQEEIKRITEAMTKAQTQMIVLFPLV